MKKIKESGFTLIELLGTIVIIGILGTVAITSVVNIKKSSNNRFDNSQVELMKQAGQTYFTDNKRLLPIVEGQTNYVTLDKLIEKGYINKLYNSKKEEFDPTTSYAWVQKQNDGSYKYDCYCEIKGEKLAGTTAIPESKENNSIVTFEYENFYNNKSENKYYTNGKNNSIVKVYLNRNEVSEYRYEIYKKDTKDENSQYKISQREKLTTNLVNIKLNAKDYSDGEYFIKVTTYNSTGNSKQSSYSAKIYVDKTPPTCNITTTYQKDSNSAQKLWYSSKSKNNNNQELGVNSKLPISVDGSDKGSGIKLGSKHIFSDSEYTKQINNETGTYEAENTGKNGKEYYATVEDNVGNKATCSQIYYIDTTPPTCSSKGIEKGNKGNKVQDKQWYLGNVTTYGYFTDENSGVTNEKQLSKELTETRKNAQTSTITQKDNAGNEGSCVINNIYIDKEDPTCTSSGGSNTWKNATSDKKTTLKGTCSDVGSGCVAGIEAGKRYDRDGNVYWDITWEGSWTKRTPGTVYDEAGRSTTCPGNQTVKHDWTAPTCSISLSDSNKGNNVGGRQWYRGDVTASLSITDDTTGPTGTVKSAVMPNLDGQTLKKVTKTNNGEYTISGKVTDEAGNSTTCQSANFGIDKIKPTCSINVGSPNKNDWYTSNVNASITANDDNNNKKLSDIDDSKTKIKYGNTYNKSSVTVSDEGENKVINGEVYDNAGNTNTCSKTIKLDKTPPSCPNVGVYPGSGSSEVSPKTWLNYALRVMIYPKADNASGLDNFEWFTKDENSTFSKESTQEDIKANGSYIKILGNATEYEGKATGKIKIYDKAGNSNDCQTDEYWIDRKKPSIDVFSIESNDLNYNTVWPNIKVKVNDKYNVKYGIYSDFTPITDDARKYTTKGSEVTINFSELNPDRIDNFNGHTNYGYNGETYTVKVSATDEAGNTNSKSATYTVYTDCTHNYDNAGTVTSCDNDWSACTAACGGGIQYATGNATWNDEFTGSSCSRKVANGCSQNCNTQNCCSSTYIGDYGDWGEATGTPCETLTEYRDVYYYSNYNNNYCGMVENGDSQSYSDSTWTDCGDWGKCNSNNKKKKTCKRISDYDDSTVCGPTFEKTMKCSHTPNVPCNNSDKVFGTNKGSNAGNFGKWVNISFKCNGTTPVVGGYVRKCIIDDCEGMTAEKVNSKFGCSYSKYWCNSSNPNKKKW